MKQKLAFLAVGGVNTVFGTVVFFFVDRFVNPSGKNELLAVLALVISFFITTPFAYFMQRTLVFKPQDPIGVKEFLRFASVTASAYGLNAVLLPVLLWLINQTGLHGVHLGGFSAQNSFIAQLITSFVLAVAQFVSHQRFSFKSSAKPESDATAPVEANR